MNNELSYRKRKEGINKEALIQAGYMNIFAMNNLLETRKEYLYKKLTEFSREDFYIVF